MMAGMVNLSSSVVLIKLQVPLKYCTFGSNIRFALQCLPNQLNICEPILMLTGSVDVYWSFVEKTSMKQE